MPSTFELDLFLKELSSDINRKNRELKEQQSQVNNFQFLKEKYPDLYMKNKKLFSYEARLSACKAYMDFIGCDGDRLNVIPYTIEFIDCKQYNIHYDCYIRIGNVYDNGIRLIDNWKNKIIDSNFDFSNLIVEDISFQLKDKINGEINTHIYAQKILFEKIELLKNINVD